MAEIRRNSYTVSDRKVKRMLTKADFLPISEWKSCVGWTETFEGVFIMLTDYLNSTMTVTSPLAGTKTECVCVWHRNPADFRIASLLSFLWIKRELQQVAFGAALSWSVWRHLEGKWWVNQWSEWSGQFRCWAPCVIGWICSTCHSILFLDRTHSSANRDLQFSSFRSDTLSRFNHKDLL